MAAIITSAPVLESFPAVPREIQDWLVPRPWLALYGNWLPSHVSSEREVCASPYLLAAGL